ncbi:MAG: TetR/AcrR family transcriptional regulator [Syntrophomonadaceae bacterium]|nr:TetR/AcrR family transcriptional regulator [Syntrophomonadaceae bacterium]
MPKIVDHDEFRQELLEKYFDLFAKTGYLNVSMREIAAQMGVTTGTLYHYFPNKNNLLEELFYMASRQDTSEALAKIPNNATLAERTKVFCEFVEEKEVYFQDIVLLTIDNFRYKYLADHQDFTLINEADNHYGNKIAEGLELDDKYGFMLAIFLNGLVYHRLVFPDSVSFSEQIQLFQEMFTTFLQNENNIRKE